MKPTVLLVTLLVAAPVAFARPASGAAAIWGQVTVVSARGPLSGAVVRLECQTQRFAAALESDSKGRFGRLGLPAGTYKVTISCPGYADVEIYDVVARPGRRLRLDVDLTPIDEAPFARERRRFRAPMVDVESAAVEYSQEYYKR